MDMRESITRAAARTAGLKRFFTGRPCRNGHIDDRWVASGMCLECSRQWKKIHYIPKPRSRISKEERAARERQWAKERYHRNPEAHKLRAKRWKEKNVAQQRAYAKAYNRTRDPIASCERAKAWSKSNPLKKQQQDQIRRARKANSLGRFLPSDIGALMQKQGGRCFCGRDIHRGYTIDHVIPLSRGGSNWPDNLQLLCKSCNSSKGPKTMSEWLEARGITDGMKRGIERAYRDGRPVTHRSLPEWRRA